MDTLPSLLTRALRLCNAHGRAVAIGVAVFGVLTLLLQMLFWNQLIQGTKTQLQSTLSPTEYAAIQAHVEKENYMQEDLHAMIGAVQQHVKEQTKEPLNIPLSH